MTDELVCVDCGAYQPASPICRACDAITPLPAGTDHYAALALPPALALNADDLRRRYYELSRRLHPDRFTAAPAPQRQTSARNMAAVNLAYRTLRDPVLRARYWLTLRADPAEPRDPHVPPELAERVMNVQELLASLRESQPPDERASTAAKLRQIREQLVQMRQEVVASTLAIFPQADENDAAAVTSLRSQLATHAYVAKMIRDIEAELVA